ncbi:MULTISPECIES: hypothetical protein [unclassified Massilia]|uniref:hypothetical protein n=1 Tax=unclassified Massilia TaxID=2609279 RepID=UPI0017805834|nr:MULTISPECIES: hypothetical protein [unclassified Massilia]MBD8531569.1 hypothetical protein [Massilia sp. CFBP 13647]MBD8673635.1 hypothetical protein [Massilia sp. CFBP 13721]
MNRIKTTTTTTGTGSITVSAGAAARCRPLSDIAVGRQVAMMIEDEAGSDWELSLCTILSATTFSRDTVLHSSNGGAKVNFGAGTKTVFATMDANAIDRGSSARVFYLSKMGAVSDTTAAVDGTDNTAAIQAVFDKAVDGPIRVVVDGLYLAAGLRIRSTTHLDILPGCDLKLKTGSNKTLLENYNRSFNPASRIDHDIKITGGSTNGNRGVNRGDQNGDKNDKGNGTVGLNCNMRFYGVSRILVEDHLLYNSPSYACHFLNCTDGTVRNVRVDVGPGYVVNNDGINVGGNCHRFLLENIVANTSDDPISTSPDDVWAWTPGFTYPFYVGANGSMSHITVRDVMLDNAATYGIRVMSGVNPIDHAVYSNIKGKTNFGHAILLDNRQVENDLTGVAGIGNIQNILLDDIEVDVTGACVIRIRSSAQHVVIRALKRRAFNASMPTILIDGNGVNLESLWIIGYNAVDATSNFVTKHFQMVGGTVKEVRITDSRVKRAGAANGSVLLETSGGAVINSLIASGVSLENITNLLANTNGTIGSINAANITHSGGSATFATASTIPRLNLSGYLPSGGAVATSGTFTQVSGDGVSAVADTTPPTVISAAVANGSPTVVRFTMSENMGEAYVPAASAFLIAGHTSTAVAVSGIYIDVTVTPAFVAGEAARTGAYTQPGTGGNARDLSGNMLANFAGQAIVNNVAGAASPIAYTLGNSTITNDGSNVWTTTQRGYPTGGYNTYGRSSTQKIAANSDGFIYCQHPSGLQGIYVNFGLALDNTIGSPIAAGFITYENTAPITIIAGGAATGGPNGIVGNHYGVRRKNGVLTLETSADGVTWSVIHNYGSGSTAALYPAFYLAADAGANLYHPMGVGLT